MKDGFVKTVLKHSSWYYLCSALNNGLAILLLPFLSRHMTTDEYGIVQLSTAIGLFLPMLYSLGIEKVIYRYFNVCKNIVEKKQLVSTVYWFSISAGIVILTIITFLSPFWFEPIVHVEASKYVCLFTYPYLLSQISAIGLTVCQQSFKHKELTIIEVLSNVINLFLSVYFVLTWEDGAIGRLSAITIAFLFKAVLYTIILLKYNLLNFEFHWNKLKKYLSFSIPLLPNSIGLWVTRTFDRVLVSYFCGIALAGVYSTGVQVSFVLYFIQDAASQALGPLQIKSFSENKSIALKRLKHLSVLMFLMMFLFTLWFTSVCEYIMDFLLNDNFIPSMALITPLCMVFMFQVQYRLFSDVIMFNNKNKYFVYATGLQAATSLFLNCLCLPLMGYWVAGVTNLISIIFYTIFIIYKANRLESIGINFMNYSLMYILNIIIIYCLSVVLTGYSFYTLFLKICMLLFVSIFVVSYIVKRFKMIYMYEE